MFYHDPSVQSSIFYSYLFFHRNHLPEIDVSPNFLLSLVIFKSNTTLHYLSRKNEYIVKRLLISPFQHDLLSTKGAL